MLTAVSIIGPKREDVRADVKLAKQQGADILEIRTDMILNGELGEDYHYTYQNYTAPIVEALLSIAGSSSGVLYTNRHQAEAGPNPNAGFRDEEGHRQYLLDVALAKRVTFVDVEANHPLSLEKRQDSTQVIWSYHDFNGTPRDIVDIYKKIRREHIAPKGVNARPHPNARWGDAVKIATMANSKEDAIRMLEAIREIALLDNPSTHRFIGICMGGHGKSTRSI